MKSQHMIKVDRWTLAVADCEIQFEIYKKKVRLLSFFTNNSDYVKTDLQRNCVEKHSGCLIYMTINLSALTAQFMCLETFRMVCSTSHLQQALALSWQEKQFKCQLNNVAHKFPNNFILPKSREFNNVKIRM